MELNGGKAENLKGAFSNETGAIVNASRSLMFAYQLPKWKEIYSEEEFEKATRAEALDMKKELNKIYGEDIL